jgi:dihydrofolate reductase
MNSGRVGFQNSVLAAPGEFEHKGGKMSKLRVASFSVSFDGYGAGPNQSLENPLGVGGESLHQWVLSTRTFQQRVRGAEGGATGIDDDFAARGFRNVGAWILGRNMFGPIRGPWPDDKWSSNATPAIVSGSVALTPNNKAFSMRVSMIRRQGPARCRRTTRAFLAQ